MENENGAVKHAFLPTPENGHHPHVLRRTAIVTTLSFLVLVEALMLGTQTFDRSLPQTASVLPAVLTEGTNAARASDNLAALTWNTKLATAAQAKANDMAAKGYFAHVSPDGTTPWKWIKDAGYAYEYAGENLAVDFSDSEDVVSAWLNSPTHRANILGSNYTEIGIGIASGIYKGKETLFVVQEFGKPIPGTASVASAPSIEAKPKASAPVAAAPASTSTNVLGAETTASPVAEVIAAPRSNTNFIFGMIAALFALLLILALVFRKRLPRGAATIGGLSVVATSLALMLLNNTVFATPVTLPLDTQSAAVYEALPSDTAPVAPADAKG